MQACLNLRTAAHQLWLLQYCHSAPRCDLCCTRLMLTIHCCSANRPRLVGHAEAGQAPDRAGPALPAATQREFASGSERLQLGATHSHRKVSTWCSSAHHATGGCCRHKRQLASAHAPTLLHLCIFLLTTPSTCTAGGSGCQQQLSVPPAGPLEWACKAAVWQ